MSSADPVGMVSGLDPAGVSGWIEGLGLGIEGPLRIERIGKGLSNLTFLVTGTAGPQIVLRRPPLGDLLASAHDVERECGILRALEATAVPAPRIHGLCVDPAVCDVPLVAMEAIEGTVIDSVATAEDLPAAAGAALGEGLAQTLAAIHAVDLEDSGLAALSRSKTPYAARQIRRWGGQWEDSRMRDLPALEELGERLASVIPESDEVALVHGDFHPLNLIIGPTDGRIEAVLDWELSTLGDPLADLGGLLAYWPEAGEEGGPRVPFGSVEGFPSRAQIAELYAEASGRSLDHLGFWHALGLWKVAIILEGVLRRARNDRRNPGLGESLEIRHVDVLIEQAWAVAEAWGIFD